MMKKLFLNLQEKVGTEFWLLNPDNISKFFFYLLILFLPTQFGKHFWPSFSFVYGLRLDYLSPTLYATDVLIFLIFVFSFRKIFKYLDTVTRKYLILYFLFLISLFLPLPFSKNAQAGIFGILKIVEYTYLFLFIYFNFKSFNKKIIFYTIPTSIIFESLLSILQFFNKGSMGGLFYFLGERFYNGQIPGIANANIKGELFLRPYGTFSHPNVLAGFLVISGILALIFFQELKDKKTLLFTSLIAGSASLLLTLSRVAILIWLILTLFFFGSSIYKKYKKTISNVIKSQKTFGLIFFSIIVLVLFFTPVGQRFFQTKLSDESFAQREYLISQSLKMFYSSPLLGVGINNYYNNLSTDTYNNKILLVQPVHNIFLLTISEEGLIGFLFLIYLLYKISRKLWFKSPKLICLQTLFLSVIVLGMFDHYLFTVQQGQLLFTISAAILASYNREQF